MNQDASRRPGFPPWNRLRGALYRRYLALRFSFLDRRRHDRLSLETIAGKPFLVLPQVFNPALFFTSEFLVRSLDQNLVPPGCRLLDMGTGSGVAAVFAARWAGQVMAVDVNPAAVRCARINVLLSQVEDRVQVRQSDLFSALEGQRFDVVLFNPPYFRGRPRTPLDRAFYGEGVPERFARGLAGHLSPGGYCLLILSSSGAGGDYLQAGTAAGLEPVSLATKTLPSETLILYRLAPAASP